MTKSRKAKRTTTSSGRPQPDIRSRDPRWWIVTLVSGFGAYVAASHGLLFTAGVWQIPLFVGCVVGLIAVAPVQGASVAGSVTLVSLLLLPPALPFMASLEPFEFVLALALSSGSAATLAYARLSRTGDSRRVVGQTASVALVLWILVNLWLPLFVTGLPIKGYGVLRSATISEVPAPGTYRLDEEVYRRVYYLMHQGKPYYAAFRDAWTQQLTEQPAPDTVMGYRLPTLYWLWRRLPSDAFSLVYLYLALCSVGVVCAGFIAGQLVGARFAPLAAAAMAAYVMGVGITTAVTYVDLPATSIALAGIALFVRAGLSHSRRALWAAAGVFALAALTREILAYLIVLAALSALLEAPERRWRAAAPWIAALSVFTVGYALHAIAARGYLSADSPVTYMRGSLDFMVNALTNFSQTFSGHGAALSGLFALGVAGAIATHRRMGWPFAGFATAALLLPMLAMLRIGNNSVTAEGAIFNYWGMLVVPLALAIWPAWALLLWRKNGF